VATHIAGLTKLTLETTPAVCHNCIWWQTRGGRTTDKDRWMEKVELDFGEPEADLRILLCHFPRALDTVPVGRWDLILAGHLHAGQIVLTGSLVKTIWLKAGDHVRMELDGLGEVEVSFD